MLAATFTIFAGLTLCPVILFGAPQSLPQEAAETISIIPQPLSVKRDDGTFAIGPSTAVVVANKDKDLLLSVGEHSAARLRQATAYALDLRVAVGVKERAGAIVLALDPADADLGDEGYRLKVTNAPVVIKGSKPAGVFYGVQTFYQLLPVEVEKSQPTPGIAWSVPCIRIEDKPRFPWRGMHLDVGRHFFSKDSVKRYIDLLAAYKVNTFHWYLTEDQGWRIEIKKYPRLTSVGAWRKETMDNNIPHGGFYTQDEIREVVEYAKERFVTVVPEIEMPGHSQAALASYPELSCSGGPFPVASEWGVMYDVYKYFEGSWNMLPDFNTLTPVRSGQIYDIDLQSFPHREDDYGVQFTAYLNLDAEGDYTLFLASDDGSKLFITGRS